MSIWNRCLVPLMGLLFACVVARADGPFDSVLVEPQQDPRVGSQPAPAPAELRGGVQAVPETSPLSVGAGDSCASCASCSAGSCGCGCGCSSCCGLGGWFGKCPLLADTTLLGGAVTNIGGELRLRWHDEVGMFGGRFSPATYNALLTRVRVWGDVQLTEDVTFHAEGMMAESGTNDGFRPIDLDRGDMRNMILNVNLTGDLSMSVGRQDFLYGAQRIVSPLDWANTRRAFDGVRFTYNGLENWSWDAFYGNLVRVLANDFNRSNYDVSLYGLYGTYKGFESAQVEPYYIGFDRQDFGFSRHMFGGRINGTTDLLISDMLYEVEAAYQFGQDSGNAVSDGFFTVGAGRKLKRLPWDALVWFYFDYATGRDGANRAGNVGYDEVLPLTHKYLGFIDAVLRSNVIAPNVLLTMKPSERMKLLLWYYYFRAENDGAIVPGVGNAPQVTGAGLRSLGNELDFIWQYDFTKCHSLLVGYSHFWAGNRIVVPNNDAEFFYVQYTWRF